MEALGIIGVGAFGLFQMAQVKRVSKLNQEDAHWMLANELADAVHHCLGVSARTDKGTPAVLKMYPLRHDKQPWVNMYWLADPELIRLCGMLECEGKTIEFQARLDNDPVLMARFYKEQEEYAYQRWALVSPKDKELVLSRGGSFEEGVRTSGVCGVRYFGRVKCCHAHYARYLGSGGHGIVGEWIHEHIVKLQKK